MTNKSPRSQNGKRPRLKLLDLNFSNNVKEVPSNGARPHGGLRGSKKHPLSPFSFNKDDKHHQQVKEAVDRQFDDDFIDRYGSPAWVVDANKEVSHSGENPLYINRLLSPCRLDNDSSFTGSRAVTPTPSGRIPNTSKRGNSLYFRQTTPHQYLSATELPVVSFTDPSPILGRPTRTTLLRARQRCNSAPINAYQKRRDVPIKVSSGNQCLSREPTGTHLSAEGETNHAFLTGARYNRARLMDVKSFNVYGVYMPRGNHLDCFMSGPAVNRMKDRNEESPAAPPDTPRSDVEETPEVKETKQKRPSTAPSKRLLSSSTPSGGRPRSARVDTSPSINYIDESENKENIAVNNNLVEKLIYLQNGLIITGRGVVVTLKGFKSPPLQKKDSILPSVTGVSVPQMRYNKKSRNTPDDSSVIFQPPPTPVGQLSIMDEIENLIPEQPKTPIPEETQEEDHENTQTENKETDHLDTQATNTELSVKIIQLTGDPNETVVVYDKTGADDEEQHEAIITGEPTKHNEESIHKTKSSNHSKEAAQVSDGKFDNENKHDVKDDTVENNIPDNNIENDGKNDIIENNVQSNTFITDKEDTVEARNIISIPNAKTSPDFD